MHVVLRITFKGLITFVPDPSQERLVALLPVTGAMGNTGVHQHHGELTFNRKYLVNTDTVHHGDRASPEKCERIPLGRSELSFAQLRGAGHVFVPPSEAISLDKLTKRPLDSEQVSPFPRSTVYSQVILPGATRIYPGETAQWFLGGRTETLTNVIQWERDLPDGERNIVIWIRYMHSAQYQALRLHAPDGADAIDLEINHLPDAADEEKDPTDGYEAVHFAAYYELYPPPAPNIIIPVLVGLPGANVFTCMTSQVSLDT